MNEYKFSFIGRKTGGASEEEIKKVIDKHDISTVAHDDIRKSMVSVEQISAKVSEHDTSTIAHDDLRKLIVEEIQKCILSSEKGVNGGVATLDDSGRIPLDQVNINVLKYKGGWDASTNTPTLSNATGSKDDFYIVSVDGSQNLGAYLQDYESGSNLVHNGVVWEQLSNKQKVVSVSGKIGAVNVTKWDVGLGSVINQEQVTVYNDQIVQGQKTFASQIKSTVKDGIEPMYVISTTPVRNLTSTRALKSDAFTEPRNVTIGKTTKAWNGGNDIKFTAEEIGATGVSVAILNLNESETSVPNGTLIFKKV